MSTFLIRSTTSQSSSYPIVLSRLGGSRSRPNPHLQLCKCRQLNPRPHGQQIDTLIPRLMFTLCIFVSLAPWLSDVVITDQQRSQVRFSTVKWNFSIVEDDCALCTVRFLRVLVLPMLSWRRSFQSSDNRSGRSSILIIFLYMFLINSLHYRTLACRSLVTVEIKLKRRRKYL